jgi:hypothetical protein
VSAVKTRVMYIEAKVDAVEGWARIGRVTLSKTGKTLRYRGRSFLPLGGRALKANYLDQETGEELWISGPRTDGRDSLRPATVAVDADCREEYWTEIRRQPESVAKASYKSLGRARGDREVQEKGARRRDMDRRHRAPPADEPAS